MTAAKRERAANAGTGITDPRWTLEPRWWRQEMGGEADAGWEIIDRSCDECRKRRGCRIASEDPVGDGDRTVLFLCTACLVADHGPVSWRWAMAARRVRAHAAREAEDQAKVEAMAGHRVGD